MAEEHLKRIPGGSWYVTCCHIVSGENPKVFVFQKNPLPENYELRQLAYDMDRKIDKLGKASYVMICMDCLRAADQKGKTGEGPGLENGAPYDMRMAVEDIGLTRPESLT